MKEMKEIKDINLYTEEGKFLWAALIELTTKLHTNKTPSEVLDLLSVIVKDNKEAFPRKKNIWGEDVEECHEFFKSIAKNAGQRDI